MSKHRTILVACVLALVTAGLTLAQQGAPQWLHTPAPQPGDQVPDHVIYGQFFHLVFTLKHAKQFSTDAGLNDDQEAAVVQIAQDCERDLVAQDAKAFAVINEFRAKVAKLPPGSELPPPPAALKGLQEGRDTIVLRHRGRLQSALGADKSGQLEQAIRRTLKIELVPVPKKVATTPPGNTNQ